MFAHTSSSPFSGSIRHLQHYPHSLLYIKPSHSIQRFWTCQTLRHSCYCKPPCHPSHTTTRARAPAAARAHLLRYRDAHLSSASASSPPTRTTSTTTTPTRAPTARHAPSSRAIPPPSSSAGTYGPHRTAPRAAIRAPRKLTASDDTDTFRSRTKTT